MTISPAKLDQKVASGPGNVEISGFPQVLHTRALGHPDMLFVPLMEGAREAAAMTERLAGLGESTERATAVAAIQLASTLMSDSSFALSARGMPATHHYVVDLAAGTMSVQTCLYAEVHRRTSMLKVEIAGKLREGLYAVRCLGDLEVTLQFDAEQLKQPMFFTNVLAEQCLTLQMQRDQARRTGPAVFDPGLEVHLTVATDAKRIPVILKQHSADGDWELLDTQTRARLGALSAETAAHLKQLFTELSTTLSNQGKKPAPSAGPPLVTAAKDSR